MSANGTSTSMKMHSPGHSSAAWITSTMCRAWHRGHAARPARIVEHLARLGHVGDAVLELDEDVGAMVEAETVAGAQVLVDPHAHGGRNGTPLCLHWLGRD